MKKHYKNVDTAKVTYIPPNHEQTNARRKPQNKIIWFNSQLHLDISTNVAKYFCV